MYGENIKDVSSFRESILVIGAGFVGKATGIGLMQKGYDVTFIDININVVKDLHKRGYKAFLVNDLNSFNFDFVFVCTPTPYLYDKKEQDLSSVYSTIPLLEKVISNNHKPTIGIRSTILPGTSRNILNMLENHTNKRDGIDFYFCTNPEFLRAKSALEDFMKPWAIVIGSNSIESSEDLFNLYQQFISKDKIYICSLEEAEFVKYAHNICNATKISFTNQIWLLGRIFNVDGNKIMSIVVKSAEALWNPEYGTKGGYPYGGLCLPKDTKGFIAWLQEKGVHAPLIDAVDDINSIMERIVLDKEKYARTLF